jgi:hypothetical protein
MKNILGDYQEIGWVFVAKPVETKKSHAGVSLSSTQMAWDI